MNVAAARTAFNVDGTGQKLGVLSDSVNEFSQVGDVGAANQLTGLAASVASGDLPPNVQVLQDLQVADGAPGSDEGRAMLEQIHDLAPGASLAFATARTGGPATMATNIEALYAAGATTIVDDVGYPDDPYYQDRHHRERDRHHRRLGRDLSVLGRATHPTAVTSRSSGR